MTERRWLEPPYMIGQTLHFRQWKRPPSDEWYDHDHCEFCCAKFADTTPGACSEGYATEDNAHWVCPECFENPELREQFQLMLGPAGAPVVVRPFEIPDGVAWTCRRCGVCVEERFAACWNCRAQKP